MHFSNLDAYFHLASQGDQEAYKILYEEFVNKAKYVLRSTLRNSLNIPVIPDDFSDYIDSLFFKAINEYDPERGSFSWYVDYLINRRMEDQAIKAIVRNKVDYDYLDYEELMETDCADYLPDPDQKSMSEYLAVENFKYKLASPKEHRTRKEKLEDKIMLLQYAGYKNVEIAKKFNMTINELRGHLKNIQKDEKIVKLKLELK